MIFLSNNYLFISKQDKMNTGEFSHEMIQYCKSLLVFYPCDTMYYKVSVYNKIKKILSQFQSKAQIKVESVDSDLDLNQIYLDIQFYHEQLLSMLNEKNYQKAYYYSQQALLFAEKAEKLQYSVVKVT